MNAETGVLTICRCGWLGIAPTYNELCEVFLEHRNFTAGHDMQKLFGAMLPMEPEAVAHFKRMASVTAAETKAIDNLERWKDRGEPVRVEDDGLGAFRGLWSVVKGWMVLAAIGLVCYGLWRIA